MKYFFTLVIDWNGWEKSKIYRYGLRLYYDNVYAIYKKNMFLQWKNEKMTLYK